MQFVSLGKIAVPTAGQPVQVSTTRLMVRGFRVSSVPGATGRMYFGVAGLKASTRAGLLKDLAAPATGVNSIVDSYERDPGEHTNLTDLSQFYVDADVSGEGPVVSYWVD